MAAIFCHDWGTAGGCIRTHDPIQIYPPPPLYMNHPQDMTKNGGIYPSHLWDLCPWQVGLGGSGGYPIPPRFQIENRNRGSTLLKNRVPASVGSGAERFKYPIPRAAAPVKYPLPRAETLVKYQILKTNWLTSRQKVGGWLRRSLPFKIIEGIGLYP